MGGSDGGLSQVAAEERSPYVGFDEAAKEFAASADGDRPVSYLSGRNMDRSGRALSWLFGIHRGNGTVLLIYDRAGWKVNPWNATLPADEIALDRIVPPATIFSGNQNAIFSQPAESVDMVLKQGVWTVTVRTNASARTLAFDAMTGGVLP